MVGFVVVAGPGNKANEIKSQPFCLRVVNPPELKCGGFESQILSTDSLARLDSAVEGALRRVERTIVEADKDATVDKNSTATEGDGAPLTFDGEERTFTVKARQWCSTTEYLKNWDWDKIKFGQPTVEETAQEMRKVADAIDANFRTEAANYAAKKNAWQLVSPPDASGPFSFASKDLVDVLTPDTVAEKDASKPSADDDFIYTKNISTVVVVVPAGQDDAFVQWHDGCVEVEKVIPSSARQLTGAGKDKDGASLYRVLVMKSGQAAFAKACRESGWTLSDFVYKGRNGFEQLKKDRTEFETAFKTSHQQLITLGLNSWSDLLQCWTHLKVLRAAVEGNLRYGKIPHLAFVSVPADATALRKQLSNILSTPKDRDMEDAEVDDYFPYVSVALDP